MDEAEILCDQIGIIDQGKLLEIDTPESLLANHFDGALVRIPHDGRIDLNVDDGILRGEHLEITTNNLDRTMRELMGTGLNLEGLSIKKPTLEDLFLKLTGTLLRS
jgi:ABC-2 type transport system ATP-binding protein